MSAPMPATSPHVVPHVVGDGRGIARVVLRDARLHLPNQIRPDVRGLGEIPPPTRAKRAIELAPIAKPEMISEKRGKSLVPGMAPAAKIQ